MSSVDLKVVLLGSEDTGKTSLIRRYVLGEFTTNYKATIGLVFRKKFVEYGERTFCLGIWDTAGSERYDSITRNYYRNAAAVIVCYDIFIPATWERAKKWVKELNETEPDSKIYLCGTKWDLLKAEKVERGISLKEINKYAIAKDCEFIEVSNKTGDNIDNLFDMIVEDYSKSHPVVHKPKEPEKYTLNLASGCYSDHPQRCCVLF